MFLSPVSRINEWVSAIDKSFFGMRIIGFVLADEDVSAPGPVVETGASVPGYSGGLADV